VKEQLSRAEARAVRAEALLGQTAQRPSHSETLDYLETQLKQTRARTASAEEAVQVAEREQAKLAERLDALESGQRQSATVSPPTNTTGVSETPLSAIKPVGTKQITAPTTAPSVTAQPATVPMEQTMTPGPAPPATAPVAQPAPLRRKTLAALQIGGRLK
jgi:hypothetical protein